MQLKNPLTLSDKVQPIAIPEFNTEFLEKTSCIVTGWGTEEEGGRVSRVLRHVTVPLVDKATCKKEYGSQDITDSMICAGVEEGGKDSCQVIIALDCSLRVKSYVNKLSFLNKIV